MQIKRKLWWLFYRALFWTALYFGLVRGVTGAANLLQFCIWACLVLSTIYLSDDQVRKQQARPGGASAMPTYVNGWNDVATVTALAWYGWHWTAVAYLVSRCLVSRVYLQMPVKEEA